MTSFIHRNLIILFIACGCASYASAQDAKKPLTDCELLALVAGNALNENIAHEIESRGLAFSATDAYRSQLAVAGADAHVLTALSKAKTVKPSTNGEKQSSPELLQHLSAAGKLLRSKQFDQVAQELNSALKSGDGPEAGFVMGELLRRQEQWPIAVSIYEKILQDNPDFPEVHTKLSYLLYRLGDFEEGLRETKAALARTPDNAEAHKNAGLLLQDMRKFDAGAAEFNEALRLKPDYQSARYDLGLLLYNKGDLDGSIAEYKKALALDPNDADVHNNLGNAYHDKGDINSAIHEYREAKRLNPKDLNARRNLGSALLQGNFVAQGIIEFHELEALDPNSEICHLCLGSALYHSSDFKGAEKEYGIAATLDPSDPEPYIHLGNLHEYQKNYTAALQDYSRALQLDGNSVGAHLGNGSVLLAKKDFANALPELRQATQLKPSVAATHDLYAQALQATGKTDSAIGEFKQSLSLDPKQPEVRMRLADALEKHGDWVGSLDQYRRASLAGSQVPVGNNVYRIITPNPQLQYKSAQERFTQHLAALKAAGKSPEAAKLEASVASTKADLGLTEQIDAAMQAGSSALMQRQWDEATRNYKQAVELGEKLHPHDGRLGVALGELGRITMGLQNFTEADALFHRQLKANEEVYGAQSPTHAQRGASESRHDGRLPARFRCRAELPHPCPRAE